MTMGIESNGIVYRLYSYFPNEKEGTSLVIKNENIEEIFKTTNEKLKRYIIKLKDKVDITEFLKCFNIEFGLSMDILIENIKKIFLNFNFKKDEIDTLIYPNAIQRIAELSIKHNATERQVSKVDFINSLRNTKRTAITKWTMALKNHKQLLGTRKKQLQHNLSQNSRERYFIISEQCVENFEEHIVNFIKEYIDKYHSKILHDKTPLFCLDCCVDKFEEIENRLYKKGIIFNNGFVNSNLFDVVRFFKEPMVTYVNKHKIKEREFLIRLIHDGKVESINYHKCDDLFVISNKSYDIIDKTDIEIEIIQLNSIEEIKYILGMRDTFE